MRIRSFLGSESPRSAGRPAPGADRRPGLLRLEPLEDRTAPATFVVNTTLDDVMPGNGKLSLREAVTKANATAEADTILLPAGVFKVAIDGPGEDGNTTGDFDLTGGVTIRGVGAGLTVIDGQQKDRVFDVIGTGPHSIQVSLLGLTVRNGSAAGDGGGIQVHDGDLTLRGCAFVGNRASSLGGGI